MVKEPIGGQRLGFTDPQRYRLAVTGRRRGRRVLTEVATLVTTPGRPRRCRAVVHLRAISCRCQRRSVSCGQSPVRRNTLHTSFGSGVRKGIRDDRIYSGRLIR